MAAGTAIFGPCPGPYPGRLSRCVALATCPVPYHLVLPTAQRLLRLLTAYTPTPSCDSLTTHPWDPVRDRNRPTRSLMDSILSTSRGETLVGKQRGPPEPPRKGGVTGGPLYSLYLPIGKQAGVGVRQGIRHTVGSVSMGRRIDTGPAVDRRKPLSACCRVAVRR